MMPGESNSVYYNNNNNNVTQASGQITGKANITGQASGGSSWPLSSLGTFYHSLVLFFVKYPP